MFCVVYDRLIKRGGCTCEDAAPAGLPAYQAVQPHPFLTACACVRRMSVITAVVSAPVICIRLSSPPLPRLSAAADMCLRSFFQMYTLMLGVVAV